jgi:hypothetical protein
MRADAGTPSVCRRLAFRVDCEKFSRAVDLDGHVHPVDDDEEVRADLVGALHGLHLVAAAQEIVGDEDLRREADELLPVASREKAPERAAGSVDSFEVQHGVGEVLRVGVGEPTVDLPLCLSEDARKRVGRLALERRVRQQCGHRRQLDEHVPHVLRREEDRRTHDARQ